MIYCIYLKLFEWMNNVMFIVGYLDIECIYIYMYTCLAQIFSPTFPTMTTSQIPQQLPPMQKNKRKKGGHWERCPLGISANHEQLEGAGDWIDAHHDFLMAYL